MQEYVKAVGDLALRAFAAQLDLNSRISDVPVVQDRIKRSSRESKYQAIDCGRHELVLKMLDVENLGSRTSDDNYPLLKRTIPLR